MDRALRDESVEPFSHDVLLSARNWTEQALSSGEAPSSGQRRLEPPFRSLSPERLGPYIARLLNEWLPAEVARLLIDESKGGLPDAGIPGLAVARALDSVLVRERLSPETLEMFLAPDLLSPKLAYASDVEILRDLVLALLGRTSAPPPPVLPAMLLDRAGGEGLPPDYDEAFRRASIDQSEGREQLHVPITEADALRILSHDPVRIGSVAVTADGRAWLPWKLQRGDQNLIVYRPADRLRIDYTADHAKLTVPWPEAPSWTGPVSMRGPFELFGREWRAISWEIAGESTLLHLTFSRVLPISDAPARTDTDPHLRPAHVEMGWSELERAVAEALSRNSADPIEQMRREELIPLGRALCAFAESVQRHWLWNAKHIEAQLRAIRYHQGSVVLLYGRAPWRILPAGVQASLAKRRLTANSIDLLAEIFSDVPKPLAETARRPAAPSQAA